MSVIDDAFLRGKSLKMCAILPDRWRIRIGIMLDCDLLAIIAARF
jgi:hypothetical protein